MERKKKYHGGLFVFFCILSVFLFGNCLTSYALTSTDDMTVELMQEIVSTVNDNISVYTYKQPNTVSSFKDNVNYTNLVDSFKSNIDDAQYKTTYLEQLCVTYTYDYGMNVILFIPNNSGIGNELNHLRLTDGSDTKSITGGADILFMSMNSNGTYNFGYWGSSCNLYTTQSISFTNDTVATIPGFYSILRPAEISYLPIGGSDRYFILNSNTTTIGYIEPTPEEPSGDNPSNNGGLGNITSPSGDNGGNINLQPIVNSIDNVTNTLHNDNQQIINNQNQNTQSIINSISGEVNRINNTLTEPADDVIDDTYISSGDIYSSLGIQPITNPYTNLWTTLLNGFQNALTSANRNFYIEFRDKTYVITVDMITSNIPAVIKTFLGILITVYVVICICRWTKFIIDDISTASITNVANKLTEDFVTNMF